MKDQNTEIQNENSISLTDIFLLLKKFWKQVVCIILVCTVVAGVYAALRAKPKYSATATFMINYVPAESTTTNDRNALLYSIELIDTVSDFASTEIVADDVKAAKAAKIASGEETNIETGYRSNLTITTSENNLIVTLKYVTKTGGKEAVETVNQVLDSVIAVANSTDENGKAKFSTLNGTLVKVDDASKYSVSQTWPQYVLIGLGIGVVLALVYVLLKFVLDDTIKSRSQLEKITGFKAIAFIEDIDNEK